MTVSAFLSFQRARNVPSFIFCNLGHRVGGAPEFLPRQLEKLRYNKRCTFGFVSLERNSWQPAFERRIQVGMTLFCTVEFGSVVEGSGAAGSQ